MESVRWLQTLNWFNQPTQMWLPQGFNGKCNVTPDFKLIQPTCTDVTTDASQSIVWPVPDVWLDSLERNPGRYGQCNVDWSSPARVIQSHTLFSRGLSRYSASHWPLAGHTHERESVGTDVQSGTFRQTMGHQPGAFRQTIVWWLPD